MTQKKFFSLEEANALVPQLLNDVSQIQSLTGDLMNKYPDVKNAWENHKYNGGSLDGASYLNSALKVNRLVSDLESMGCVVKGIKEGLVDFPSVRDGREIYLCWKAPEQEIRFWHEMDAGFAGRQPI